MKHLLVIAALVATSASAQIQIASTPDGDVWVGYPETFTQVEDGVSLLVGLRKPERNEVRAYLGIEYSTCKTGHGDLYYKHRKTDKWEPMANVSLVADLTVADNLANVLCMGAAKLKSKAV